MMHGDGLTDSHMRAFRLISGDVHMDSVILLRAFRRLRVMDQHLIVISWQWPQKV